jgi:DNA-3-methyladenine glycosylase II
LPINYDCEGILAFHRRDPQEVAERVAPRLLQKGLVWEGHPACLTIRFRTRTAVAALSIDGPSGKNDSLKLDKCVRRMLGLTQPIEIFEKAYSNHPQLGQLIARHPGLRFPLTSSPFEAITWAIVAQQISVRAAVALRRKLIQAAGIVHSSGLYCYPDARHIARLTPEMLRAAGFTRTKADALLAITQQVLKRKLHWDVWEEIPPIERIRDQLLEIKGIGPWTVDYALLRGFGWLDGSLHNDVAVRRALQSLLGTGEKVSATEAKAWLDQFSPWRALVAAHLWALNSP